MDKTGEYLKRGDYHKYLFSNWSYYPLYLSKHRYVIDFLKDRQDQKILDVGCGEGVFVEELKDTGFDIEGIDENYSSPVVKSQSHF